MDRRADIDGFLAAEPSWSIASDQPGGSTILAGPATILGPTGVEYRFDLEIEIPLQFPGPTAHPVVKVIDGPVRLSAEVHADIATRLLCIQMPYRREIDYAVVGLAGFFEQVLLHLYRMVIFHLTGRFPGPTYAHGEDGKKEFQREVTEQLPAALRKYVQPGLGMPPDIQRCPCGSGLRFKHCHKSKLKEARAAYLESGGRPREARPNGRRGS